MRVEAVDLVDDGHGREGGVVGAGEQVPRRRDLAPLRYVDGEDPSPESRALLTSAGRRRDTGAR